LLCSQGFFSIDGSSFCATCPLGTFQDNLGQSVCKNCQSSTFQEKKGSATCTPCPLDFTAIEKQHFFYKDCRHCFNATSWHEQENDCCNASDILSLPLNLSSIEYGAETPPATYLVQDLDIVINAAFQEINLPNFINLKLNDLGWSTGEDSKKFIQLQMNYGGFQLRFDQYINEFLGFKESEPKNGPTSCWIREEKPANEVNCIPCKSSFQTSGSLVPLHLRSRYLRMFEILGVLI
jgi:hypothetical protein